MSGIKDVKATAVKITLDKERSLLYDLNAWGELEEQFGSIEEVLKIHETKSVKSFTTLLWAGLIHEDDTLTQKDVGKMLTFRTLTENMPLITEAIENSMPELTEEQKKEADKFLEQQEQQQTEGNI